MHRAIVVQVQMSVYLGKLSREVRLKKRFENEHRQVERETAGHQE